LSRLLKRLKGRSRIEKEAVRGLETVFANHFRLFGTRLSMGIDDALLWFTSIFEIWLLNFGTCISVVKNHSSLVQTAFLSSHFQQIWGLP